MVVVSTPVKKGFLVKTTFAVTGSPLRPQTWEAVAIHKVLERKAKRTIVNEEAQVGVNSLSAADSLFPSSP